MDDNKKIDEMEMPKGVNNEWPRKILKASEIVLDSENPRLDLSPNATQADIRKSLFEQEKIIELIESILDNQGLFPGEDIIVLQEGGKYKVLEGNRRVCAIQCILSPTLAPVEFQGDIKELIKNSNINVQGLEMINGVVAPSWESAQNIITARHSLYKIEPWSYISKWRRDFKQFNSTRDVDRVSNILGEERGKVVENLKNYAYVRYMLEIQGWKEEERAILSNNNLEISPLPWHMSSTKLQKMLGISFDSNYNLITTINPEKFRYVFEKLIRSMFLGDHPRITTRTDKDVVISQVQKWMEDYDATNVNESPGGSTTNPENPSPVVALPTPIVPPIKPRRPIRGKPERYFGSLAKDVKVRDQRLNRLTYELISNNMRNRPASGILLIRALIESALLFRIDKRNLTNDLKTKYKKDVNYIDLKELLTFCIENTEKLFQDSRNAKQALEKIQSTHRDYMNSIVHGSWLDPTASEIEAIAGTTRELLRAILSDSP